MSRTADQARTILTDATVLATYIDAAMQTLHDHRGGYPTSTPGAAPATPAPTPEYEGPCTEPNCTTPRPCPNHDTDITLTQPERDANTHDQAAIDATNLAEHLRLAAHHTRNAANIAARWGHPASTTTTIAQQLAAIDQSIWCRNCSRHGHKEPRRERKTECAFCAVFRQDYGLDAPKTILDARDARGGRLYVQDIERILTRDHPGWEKTAPIKRAKKRKPKAA